jgi:hypothetical protein
MALYIGIGVAVFLVAFIAFIASRPTDYRVERSATVNASPDTVFAIINDLHQWGLWSPYDGRDPNMKKTYSGPDAGPGAGYAWNGNKDVGEGKLTIVSCKPGELVTMKLEFTRPFVCTNEVNFKIQPVAGGSRVSWIMDGKNNFMSKTAGLFINMDKMIGTDFEKGLENLGRVVQATPV